jgi:hypothetical protein
MILNNTDAGNAVVFFTNACFFFWVRMIFMKVRKHTRLHFLAVCYLNIYITSSLILTVMIWYFLPVSRPGLWCRCVPATFHLVTDFLNAWSFTVNPLLCALCYLHLYTIYTFLFTLKNFSPCSSSFFRVFGLLQVPSTLQLLLNLCMKMWKNKIKKWSLITMRQPSGMAGLYSFHSRKIS